MVNAHGNASVLNGTARISTAAHAAVAAAIGAASVPATAVLTVAATEEVHRFTGRGARAIVLVVAHAVVVSVSRSAAAATGAAVTAAPVIVGATVAVGVVF